MIDKKTIDIKMHELEEIIDYSFKKISYLSNAMCAIKINNSTSGKNNSEHANDVLATVGDCILKAILAIDIYSMENSRRGYITIEKSSLEKNDVLFKVAQDYEITNYAFNDRYFLPDAPQNYRVANPKHNQYIEAIVAAIYFDRGFNEVKKWVLHWLKPRLENSIDSSIK